jgi:hypothetical protein
MGFGSLDDLVTEITTNGKFVRADWNKITGAVAYTAGRWYDFSNLNGTPVANAWAGTSLAWTSCNESTGNGTQIFGLQHGGNVSTDTKHLLNISAITAVSTGVPAQLMLVDLQGYWPGIANTSATAQTLTGTPTLRYTNGAGCRLFWVQTVAAGATAQNIALSYSNTTPTSGRSLPITVSMTASAIVGHISHSGTAANNYGPFLPLASGDTGVSTVATVTFSAANSAGSGALCLARPLLTLPLATASVAAERDLLNQLPSLPRVIDGACLVWLYFAGAATGASTNFYGSVEMAWG